MGWDSKTTKQFPVVGLRDGTHSFLLKFPYVDLENSVQRILKSRAKKLAPSWELGEKTVQDSPRAINFCVIKLASCICLARPPIMIIVDWSLWKLVLYRWEGSHLGKSQFLHFWNRRHALKREIIDFKLVGWLWANYLILTYIKVLWQA